MLEEVDLLLGVAVGVGPAAEGQLWDAGADLLAQLVGVADAAGRSGPVAAEDDQGLVPVGERAVDSKESRRAFPRPRAACIRQ